MTKRLPTKAAAVLAVAFVTGCTWVDLTPEGEKVVVLSADEVEQCERLGHTTVSLRDRVAGFQRKPEKVREELARLARNSAVEMNGDAVVPESEVDNGRQRFGVYDCRP